MASLGCLAEYVGPQELFSHPPQYKMHFRNEDRNYGALPMTVMEIKLPAGNGNSSGAWGSLSREAGGREPRLWHIQHISPAPPWRQHEELL